MIRFINISNQIIRGEFCFAWFDTVQDRFIEINDTYVWESWLEFKNDYQIAGHTNPAFTLDRFSSLFYDGKKDEER